MAIDDEHLNDLEVLWGCRAIAQEINATPTRTNYLLASGYIPGARKVGGTWTITRAKLRQAFEGEAA